MKLIHATLPDMSTLTGNKLFLMQSLYDMDIDPARPSNELKWGKQFPSTPHHPARDSKDVVVLYLYDFPASTSVDDIYKVLALAGYSNVSSSDRYVELNWIDGTSVLVIVTDKQVSNATSDTTATATDAAAVSTDDVISSLKDEHGNNSLTEQQSVTASTSISTPLSVTTPTDTDRSEHENHYIRQLASVLPPGWRVDHMQEFERREEAKYRNKITSAAASTTAVAADGSVDAQVGRS